ncbi:MAG: DUF2155 domain-containing protein, partial [Pseudomonadota bacterium]
MRRRFSSVLVAVSVLAGTAAAQQASVAPGATIRLLDRVTGQLEDVDMRVGQTARLGQIDIGLAECRYP